MKLYSEWQCFYMFVANVIAMEAVRITPFIIDESTKCLAVVMEPSAEFKFERQQKRKYLVLLV